jgi:hypothetical protein
MKRVYAQILVHYTLHSSTFAFSISRINATSFTSSSNPALDHGRRYIKASTVSEQRLILDKPKTSFPPLNALSLDALLVGIVKMSFAMQDKRDHLRYLCAKYCKMPYQHYNCLVQVLPPHIPSIHLFIDAVVV